MSKSKDQNEESDVELDEYYQETIGETKRYISRLKDPQVAQVCKKWIERLNYAKNQRPLRNQYLAELYWRLKDGQIEGVFRRAPSKGPLVPYQKPLVTETDSCSESSASTQIARSCKHHWVRSKEPSRPESPPKSQEVVDETDEALSQDGRSELSPKAQFCLENTSKVQLHIHQQKIDHLTDTVRDLQAKNEYLNQQLLRRQGREDGNEVHQLRVTVKQKNGEISDLKSRVLQVQQMNKNIKDCHEEIIHRCRDAMDEQVQRFKFKLRQEEMKSEQLSQEVDKLTLKVEKLSQEKEEELRLKQENQEELQADRERAFESKYKHLESINGDLIRENEMKEKNILLLNTRLQELENKLQSKSEEEAKLQSLLNDQCSTMKDEFMKIRNEMEEANKQQNQVLIQKISSLKKCLLKLEKSKQKIILDYKQKIFEMEKNKEIEMKTLELHLQEQHNELSTSLSSEKQCELDSLVNMLEERYKGFVIKTEAMADSQRQKYLQKLTDLENQLCYLKSTIKTDGTYV
uniref:AKAP9_1 protein n=1 Tax=Fopius arisanus TaxID=64838 RepID=A0A0C9Q5N0_9HYME